MSPGGGYDDAVVANKGKGFYNHYSNAVTKTGPKYSFWEVKEGISAKEFQEFSIRSLKNNQDILDFKGKSIKQLVRLNN